MKKIKVKNIITDNVYLVYEHKLNKEKHIPYIPKPIKLLPNKLTLTCKQCGNEQTYSNKYSYRRAIGITNKNEKKSENIGMCGKCSKREKRIPHGNRTPKQVEKMRETAIIHQTPYDSIEEWAMADRKRKKWYNTCDRLSLHNLRKYKPSEYKRLMANRWDGTNYEIGLTIEHSKPKSECYKRNALLECADSSNLKVVTMKENIRLWKKYDRK